MRSSILSQNPIDEITQQSLRVIAFNHVINIMKITTQGSRSLNQNDFKSRICDCQCSTHPRDTPTDYQYSLFRFYFGFIYGFQEICSFNCNSNHLHGLAGCFLRLTRMNPGTEFPENVLSMIVTSPPLVL